LSLTTSSRRRLALVLLPAALTLLSFGWHAASADATSSGTAVAFDYGSTYRVLFTPAPAGWEQPAFNDSGWSSAEAPFENENPAGCPFPASNTYWAEGSTIAVRKTFSLPAGAHMLRIVGTIDNDVTVSVNGTPVAFVADGFCHMDGIDVLVPDGLLNAGGQNVIAALAVDTGATTFFDIKATYSFTAADCKKGGWTSLTRADGSTFLIS
jgi:hypothetical protein